MIKTGHFAFCITPLFTLPNNILSNSPLPEEPITIRSIFLDFVNNTRDFTVLFDSIILEARVLAFFWQYHLVWRRVFAFFTLFLDFEIVEILLAKFIFDNHGFSFNCKIVKNNNLKIAKYDTTENTLLVGFPSNGLVGTFSISYLIHYLKMKQIGEIEMPDLPSTVFVEEGELLAPIRAYNKNNLFVIISDVPFDQLLANEFALAVHEFCKKNAVKKIVIVSGMETINKKNDTPKIYGLITHSALDIVLYNNQIPKFLNGSIFGTDAAIISVFRKTSIPALVLYAECHPFFPDPEASIIAIVTLAKILDVKVDTHDIKNRIDKLRIQHRNLMEETIRTLKQNQEKQTRAPQIYR